MVKRSAGGIGAFLALALLVASVPVCPCAPGGGQADHACCAPDLAISAGHGDCCAPAPELTGAQADGPAPARLDDVGPAPEPLRLASERPADRTTAPAPSPPSILRI